MSDHGTCLIDSLGAASEQHDLRVTLHERMLPAQAFAHRHVVGVEARKIGSPSLGNAAIERRDDALMRLLDDAHAAIHAAEFRQDVAGVVIGSVVNHQKLEIAEILRQHAGDALTEPCAAVVYRHDDRYRRTRGGVPVP